MRDLVYLDNNSTSPPSERALSEMLPFLTERWGAFSSPHKMGRQLSSAVEESYRKLYKALGASEEDSIILTSDGAEAVAQVIYSIYRDVSTSTGKNQIITIAAEEAPILMSVSQLEPLGCIHKRVKVDGNGQINAESLIDELTPRTALVTLSTAHGLTGVIQPIHEIARVCDERGIYLHLDATHTFGKIYFELEDTGAHYISFNGEQLHAPRGTGALWVKKKAPISPLIPGGMEQGGLRGGNLNVAALVALAIACEEALLARDYLGTEIARLRSHLESELCSKIAGAKVLFDNADRLPNTTCIAFPGIAAEALLYLLDQKGVFASMGGGSQQQLSLVLQACGVQDRVADSALSFSLSRYTTDEEIEKAIDSIVAGTKTLLRYSEDLL